jgi:uncharacterized membrane protein YphA (DoxX/SURF4 family)
MVSATTPSQTGQARTRRRANTVLWGVQILLAVIFLSAAGQKLAGVHSQVTMFSQIGAGQWLRYFVGAAELAGAIGLVIRRLAVLAAVGLAADMLGATIINLAVLHSAAAGLTIPLCAVLAFIAWNRRDWISTLRGGSSSDTR